MEGDTRECGAGAEQEHAQWHAMQSLPPFQSQIILVHAKCSSSFLLLSTVVPLLTYNNCFHNQSSSFIFCFPQHSKLSHFHQLHMATAPLFNLKKNTEITVFLETIGACCYHLNVNVRIPHFYVKHFCKLNNFLYFKLKSCYIHINFSI